MRQVRRVTFAGMAVNVAIAAAKAVGGVAFSSHALVADAVHSASDLVTDLAVLLGVRYSYMEGSDPFQLNRIPPNWLGRMKLNAPKGEARRGGRRRRRQSRPQGFVL